MAALLSSGGAAWCLITGVSVLSERWNQLDCRIFCVLVYFCHIALAIKVLRINRRRINSNRVEQ